MREMSSASMQPELILLISSSSWAFMRAILQKKIRRQG
jgi:hypothetical protein